MALFIEEGPVSLCTQHVEQWVNKLQTIIFLLMHWIIFELVFTCSTYCIKLKATANINIFMNKRYRGASCLLSYPICWHLIDCWKNSSTAHGGKQLNSWTRFDGTEVAWKLPEEMRKALLRKCWQFITSWKKEDDDQPTVDCITHFLTLTGIRTAF